MKFKKVLWFLILLFGGFIIQLIWIHTRRVYQRMLVPNRYEWLPLLTNEWRLHIPVRKEMEKKVRTRIKLDIFYEDMVPLFREGLIENKMIPLEGKGRGGKPMLHVRLTQNGIRRRYKQHVENESKEPDELVPSFN